MTIRGLLAGLLVAATLGGCTRSATAPEASYTSAVAAPLLDADTLPPPPAPDSSATPSGGGALGSGH